MTERAGEWWDRPRIVRAALLVFVRPLYTLRGLLAEARQTWALRHPGRPWKPWGWIGAITDEMPNVIDVLHGGAYEGWDYRGVTAEEATPRWHERPPHSDADFIAHARTDIPYLLDRVAGLEGDRERLRSALQDEAALERQRLLEKAERWRETGMFTDSEWGAVMAVLWGSDEEPTPEKMAHLREVVAAHPEWTAHQPPETT